MIGERVRQAAAARKREVAAKKHLKEVQAGRGTDSRPVVQEVRSKSGQLFDVVFPV